MSNMSYCRFQNTVGDFRDCLEAISDREELSGDEKHSAKRLYELAQMFVSEYEVYLEDMEEEEG